LVGKAVVQHHALLSPGEAVVYGVESHLNRNYLHQASTWSGSIHPWKVSVKKTSGPEIGLSWQGRKQITSCSGHWTP